MAIVVDSQTPPHMDGQEQPQITREPSPEDHSARTSLENYRPSSETANRTAGPGEASGKTYTFQEKDNGTAAPARSHHEAAATDSTRTTVLKARKRLKTGCLTCRKRRIKCSEEQPICKNCVKSKRECEGYFPRVIFKDPLSAFRPSQPGIAARLEGRKNFLSVTEPGLSIDAQSGVADDEFLSMSRTHLQADNSRGIINHATETLSAHHVSDQALTFHPSSSRSLPAFRSQWQCHCGFKSFDDLTALQPDAVSEYQKSLQDCFSIHKIAPIGRVGQSPSNGRSIISTVLENVRSCLRKEDQSLPQPNKKTQSRESLGWIPPSVPAAAANPQPLYLLLCIQHQRFTTKLLQPDLTGLHSDQDFFKLLRDSYHDMRGRWRRTFSLKTLRGIKFIQFELHEPDLVDVRRENELPPEERKDEYHYAPMPSKSMPPVGENLMLHFCTSPHCASERGILLDRIPKKLKERLRTCPTKGTGEGWGIYIQEGWHVCMIVIVAFAVLLLGSLVFFICWSVFKHDLQGASGIAMYIMALIALGIGSLQAVFELK